MVTAKATPPETPTPPAPAEPSTGTTHGIDKDDLKDALREVLPEFLTGKKEETPAPEQKRTPRSEEDAMFEKVLGAINELKSSSKPEPQTPETRPVETAPQQATRRIERALWGKK